MKASADLGRDSVSSLVLRLAIPAMIAQFVNVLYSIIDRMYIGHIPSIGAQALAGVGVCGPIVTLLTSFGTLVGLGGSILLGIRMGEKNYKKAKQILSNSFLLLCVFSLILTIAFLLLKDQLLMWFGASELTFPYANTYMTIYTAGTFFALMAAGLNYFINCQGFPMIGMATVLIGAVSNIILDPVFIFVFHMDVAGAAIATVISQFASFIFALCFLLGKKIHVKISFGNYSSRVMGRILYLGFSPFLILATDSIILIAMNTVLQKYGGHFRGRYADYLRDDCSELPSYDHLSHDWDKRRHTGNFKLQLRGKTDKAREAGRKTYPYIDALLYYFYVSCVPVRTAVFCKAFHIRTNIHGMLCMGNPHLHSDDHSTELPVCICGRPYRNGTDKDSAGTLCISKRSFRNLYLCASCLFYCKSCLLCRTYCRYY